MTKLNPTLNDWLCRKAELHSEAQSYIVTLMLCDAVHDLLLLNVQAYKKMNKELKKEQIEILKTKYGIDLEKDK